MRLIPVLTALALVLAATPAFARYLDIEDVRAMAFDKGIVTLDKVKLHNGIWKVVGEDASGHEIVMKIEAWSGRIIKMVRD
jgi:hypothetical protein